MLSLVGASCARVLGDVIVEPLRPGPDAGIGLGGGGGSLGGQPNGSCEAGQLRCNGQLVEFCVRSASERAASWRTFDDCLTGNLCVSTPEPHCQASPCSAGESSCDGATPRTCNANHDGWDDLAPCLSAAHCSTNAASCAGTAPCCLSAPCKSGQTRCVQGEMQRCNATETAWDSVVHCETDDLCLASLDDCGAGAACACQAPACQQNETRCTGIGLERCNDGRTGWDPVGICATAALCEQGRSSVPAACAPPQCEPGSHTCTEQGALLGCRIDRTGYELQQPCEGPQFCDANRGVCNPVACEAGDRRCNGAQIEVCLEDRTGFEVAEPACQTEALCDDSDLSRVHCNPPACGVDAFSCFGGAQLQRCNDGRTAFEPVGGVCLRPDLCSAERRRCDFCFPGRQECTPNLGASRVCSFTGNFFGPETPCPLGCDGPVGQCRRCTLGSYSCNGSGIARCNDGTSFTPLNRSSDCSGSGTLFSCSNNGQLNQVGCGAPGCNSARAQCNECTGTQRVCSGAGFRVCSGGALGATQSCGDGLSCSGAGACGCSPGEPRCTNGDLEFCNGLGTGFGGGDVCDDDVLQTCDENDDVVRIPCSSARDCEDSDGFSCE